MTNGGGPVIDGKTILVTGGTGSLGHAVVRRLLSGEIGSPARVIVLSRDEANQQALRLWHLQRSAATDEVMYRDTRARRSAPPPTKSIRTAAPASTLHSAESGRVLSLRVRRQRSRACRRCGTGGALGAHNLVRAIAESSNPVERVIAISTDKACKPVRERYADAAQ